MIPSGEFLEELKALGAKTIAGVPCSIFKQLYSKIESDDEIDYVAAPREDAAVGVAAGCHLCGDLPIVIMQNSGIGTSLNALTSLNLIYDIPLLMLISWRGYEGKDAPEHLVAGKATPLILDSISIESAVLDARDWRRQLRWAIDTMNLTGKPIAIMVREGVLL